MCMMICWAADHLVNEDLVRAVEEKIRENRRFTIMSLSLHFLKFHGHFFTKLCLMNLSFINCVHAGSQRCLRKNTNWNGRPVLWTFWHDMVSKVITSWAIVTGDETWVLHETPELKQQSMEWRHTSSPTKTKFKQTTSTRRIMCTMFWDRKGFLLVDFLPKGSTINAGVCCDTV